jgi:hypothetical protein
VSRCGGPLLEKREKWGTPSSYDSVSRPNGAIIATPEKMATRHNSNSYLPDVGER